MSNKNWTRDELLLAFNLYCRTPFGRLHKSNPEIILLAQKIGRTTSAVAMKLVNFASFDPIHQARNVRGLSNASRADREIWDEFNADPERLAFESQQTLSHVVQSTEAIATEEVALPSGPTEGTRMVRTRLVQTFFRDAVLASYNYRCTICDLGLLELLNASHIIPWSRNVERRADPRNGLALCAIHDRAFDRGLLTISESFSVLISGRAKAQTKSRLQSVAMIEVDGKMISLPTRFSPDPIALAYHREHIFKA
jgi:putative restriction endonuclease